MRNKKLCLFIFIIIFVNIGLLGGEMILFNDFNEAVKNNFITTNKRINGTLHVSTSEFVISNNNSLRYNISKNNVETMTRPFVMLTPKTTDWSEYNTLRFHFVALPYNHIVDKTSVIIQLRSTDYAPKILSSFQQHTTIIPTGKHVVIDIPISKLLFKKKVGNILVMLTNINGDYYFNRFELLNSDVITEIKYSVVELTDNIKLAEWYCIKLLQNGSYLQKNVYYFDPAKKVDVILEYNRPFSNKTSKTVAITDSNNDVVLNNNFEFQINESTKSFELNLKPSDEVRFKIDDSTYIIKTLDITKIVDENIDIYNKLKKSGNPFYRGIISAYANTIFTKDGYVDIDSTIKMLKDLGVNNFCYLIYRKSEKELAALPEFCKKSASEGIEVWAYLVPPTEAPVGRTEPIENRKYPPYDMDYIKWSTRIAEISVQYPNLTMWLIDDFNHNLKFYTLEYTKKMYETSKKINPRLLFGTCVYHDSIKSFIEKGYLPYTDALLWGYQHGYANDYDAGTLCNSLPVEINDYYALCKDKIQIPCIYFSAHSSWPKILPTKEYLEKAMDIAFKQAGIVWVFTTPQKGSWKYDFIKEYINKNPLTP